MELAEAEFGRTIFLGFCTWQSNLLFFLKLLAGCGIPFFVFV
jgi:hypothetical protein